MFLFGFDWLSFSNDDMANYSLGAQRFLNNGYFAVPDLGRLLDGQDYSATFYFMYVLHGQRSGSELLLALIWAVSGLNAHFIFMPVIMSLHLALVSATAAMVSGFTYSKKASVMALFLMSISPLATLGMLYQLIAQVGGLCLLCAAVTLTYRTRGLSLSRATLIGTGMLSAVVFVAIFIVYPEILPFFGLGWILYVGNTLLKSRRHATRILIVAVIVGVSTLIVLNTYAIDGIRFLLVQSFSGMSPATEGATLFPYYLMPSGLAFFWGLIPLAVRVPEPYLSLSIALSLSLFLWLFAIAVPRQIRMNTAPVCVLLTMTIVAILLYFRGSGFGLYKLAMFAQPFLTGVVAIELARSGWKPKRSYKIAVFCVIAIAATLSQFSYTTKSTGESAGSFTEVPRASKLKISRQFGDLLNNAHNASPAVYLADTANVVLAKFQSLHAIGNYLYLPSRVFAPEIVDSMFRDATFLNPLSEENQNLMQEYQSLKDEKFVEQYIKSGDTQNRFLSQKSDLAEKNAQLITNSAAQDIFNDIHRQESDEVFKFVNSPENHLIFIHSELGPHYYSPARNEAGYYQLEADPMFPGRSFAALGEHLLFRLVGATQNPRLVIELSNSVLKQHDSQLPKPSVQGITLGFVGRGSGRLFSNPIQATKIDESDYIAINMNMKGKVFSHTKAGLMRLYGRDILPDNRKITSFGRDVSVISENEFQSLQPPKSLQTFPEDLANSALEYSGVYEDGWLSERSFFVLQPEKDSGALLIKGFVPLLEDANFSTTVSVTVDGELVASKTLRPGDFEIGLPREASPRRHRIDIAFSNYQTLPGIDGRIIAVKLEFIGYQDKPLISESTAAKTSQAPVAMKSFPEDLAHTYSDHSGIYEDGWIRKESTIRLRATKEATFLVINGIVPLVDNPDFTTEIKVLINGGTVATERLGLGDFELKIPFKYTDAEQRVDIHFTEDQKLPEPDGRSTGGRINFIGFEAN